MAQMPKPNLILRVMDFLGQESTESRFFYIKRYLNLILKVNFQYQISSESFWFFISKSQFRRTFFVINSFL